MRKLTVRRSIALASTFAALAVGVAVLPNSSASAAYACHYAWDAATGYWYAGYYSGNTVQPTTSGVSTAGIEAQCLLQRYGFTPGPGTIDGVFGPKSQAAARAFQQGVNAGLVVDGKIGSASWPVLRRQP